MTAVVMASSIAGLLLTTGFPVALRIEIRLLSETRSVLEYNFPRIAVGHVYQFLLGNMINTRNETIPTEAKTCIKEGFSPKSKDILARQ